MTRKDIQKYRIQAILTGLSVPVLISVSLLFLRPEPILWWFADATSLDSTDGRIISSSIEFAGSPAFNAAGWNFVIQYEYSVDGKTYTSDRVNYSDTGSSDKTFAESYIAKYPVGKPVVVYYDPIQHAKSVLEPEVKDYQIIYLLVGSLIFGVLIAGLSFLIREPKKNLMNPAQNPIGIFDSGVGGLSVLRAIRAQMPEESVIYFGDQGHIPYGPRPMEQIRDFSEAITNFLLRQHAKIIVVACNTASAAALKYLRERFSDVQFVGMEPAVKPAAEQTSTGRVGVLATPATFQGALYASVVERFANGVELFQNTCNGLVQEIEHGNLEGDETRRILEDALLPMLEKNIDTVVLGCTHYPFVIPLIQEIVGEKVRVIDPAPAVAKQVKRLLEAGGMKTQSSVRGEVKLYTSGDVTSLKSLLPLLLGENGLIERVEWVDDSQIK